MFFFMGEHKNHFSFAIKMSMQKEEEFAIAVVDRQDSQAGAFKHECDRIEISFKISFNMKIVSID